MQLQRRPKCQPVLVVALKHKQAVFVGIQPENAGLIARTNLAKGYRWCLFEATFAVAQKQAKPAAAPRGNGDVIPPVAIPIEPSDPRPLLGEFPG